MPHKNSEIAGILETLDLGSSIAELDGLLETARVETSAFGDIYRDAVDLVPGTKGSGKSALFRIFVEFLPEILLRNRKVVIAHGVQKHGDSVFHAFKKEFDKLTEDDFVGFWCIYLVSLAHEQFIKGELYQPFLKEASSEIQQFRLACQRAKIPEIAAKKSLTDILAWTLNALRTFAPRLRYKEPTTGGEFEMDLFGEPVPSVKRGRGSGSDENEIPKYVNEIRDSLEDILSNTNLSIWLMIDRLDEIFPRRSALESRALRGLLRAMKLFTSATIRVKVFLRDDMLENILTTGEGFTALTHITARQADTLRWSEDQILTMVVKRFYANVSLAKYLKIDPQRLDASGSYREEAFYRIFPPTVHSGPNQSNTLRWIYTHTQDGRGVMTPRDVLDILTKAKQKQVDDLRSEAVGSTPYIISPRSLMYGLEELSKRKRTTYLEAEFSHLWIHISKFIGGKTEYSEAALRKLLGRNWEEICSDLLSLGLVKRRKRNRENTYWFPYVYRKGLELTQGRA